MIIERTTIINYLLPTGNEGTSDSSVMQSFMSIFVKYLRKAREPSKEGYSWVRIQNKWSIWDIIESSFTQTAVESLIFVGSLCRIACSECLSDQSCSLCNRC